MAGIVALLSSLFFSNQIFFKKKMLLSLLLPFLLFPCIFINNHLPAVYDAQLLLCWKCMTYLSKTSLLRMIFRYIITLMH